MIEEERLTSSCGICSVTRLGRYAVNAPIDGRERVNAVSLMIPSIADDSQARGRRGNYEQ